MLPHCVNPQGILGGGNMLAHWALMCYVVDVLLCMLHNSHFPQVPVSTEGALEVHFVFVLFIDCGHHINQLLFNAMLTKGFCSFHFVHLHVFLQFTFNDESFKALVTCELDQIWVVDFSMVLKCFPQGECFMTGWANLLIWRALLPFLPWHIISCSLVILKWLVLRTIAGENCIVVFHFPSWLLHWS